MDFKKLGASLKKKPRREQGQASPTVGVFVVVRVALHVDLLASILKRNY